MRMDDMTKKYKLEKFLGKGNFGSVGLFVEINTKFKFAIKTLMLAPGQDPAELRTDVIDEIKVLIKLDHP
jgi:serine/threonine protein kinase